MRKMIFPRLMLISSIVLVAELQAQTDAPMMEKAQSGLSLESPFELSMCAEDGVSAGGFDLISYRQPDGPIVGDPGYSAQRNGSVYLFASQSNLDKFEADPERYVPAYAGFCAITLALGRITCPDYSNFKIEEDRLLLFEVTGFTNGRTLWNTSPEDYRIQADANFDKLDGQQ